MMDALVKTTAAPGLTLTQVPKPVPGENDVLIKIHKTAICGTDLHIYNWDKWSQEHVQPPRVIGHEYVGEIAEVGANVHNFKIGQTVSGEGHIVCGVCRNCRAGNKQWCHATQGVGVQRDGAFAQYLCIPASNCIPISPWLDEEIVSFFDALGNATHTALMFDRVGEDVLITGAGPIGLMAASVVRHAGARHVVITDRSEFRLALARRIGAVTRAVDTRITPLAQVREDLGMTEGFDDALEISGSPAALADIIDNCTHGAEIALLGIPLQPFGVDWGKVITNMYTIRGIYGRKMFSTWYRMSFMLQSSATLRDRIRATITHRFEPADWEEAFATARSGQCGKVIFDWSN